MQMMKEYGLWATNHSSQASPYFSPSKIFFQEIRQQSFIALSSALIGFVGWVIGSDHKQPLFALTGASISFCIAQAIVKQLFIHEQRQDMNAYFSVLDEIRLEQKKCANFPVKSSLIQNTIIQISRYKSEQSGTTWLIRERLAQNFLNILLNNEQQDWIALTKHQEHVIEFLQASPSQTDYAI